MSDPKSSNLGLNLPEKGSNENQWNEPVNANFEVLDNQFSGSALVGHNHTGANGEGPQIDHENLLNNGEQTHAQIDAHIANTAIHGPFTDEQVGSVRGTDIGNVVTFNDVRELRFANATVTEEASGIVLITAQAQTPSEVLVHNDTTSAAVAWTDNFNWPSDSLLSDRCWLAATPNENDPQFRATGLTPAGPGTRALLRVDATDGAKASGVSTMAECHIPHGRAQRITVIVDSVNNDNGELINLADGLTLSFDLMSSAEYGSFNRPTARGVSLIITKNPGSDQLNYEFSVLANNASQGTASEVSVSLTSDITSVFSAKYSSQEFSSLVPAFFEGCHEFAISRARTTLNTIYLHYYFNGRQVAILEATAPVSGVPLTTQELFFEELEALEATLLSQNPVEPTYGRIGFGVGYSVAAGNVLNLSLRCVTASSQDDLQITSAGLLPNIPDDPDPGGPEEPVCPASTTGGQTGGAFDTTGLGDILEVLDNFDFDGPGGIADTNWVVQSTFAAGTLSSNAAGFFVEESGGSSYPAFCEPPQPPPVDPPVNKPGVWDGDDFDIGIGGDQGVIYAQNLPAGDLDTQLGTGLVDLEIYLDVAVPFPFTQPELSTTGLPAGLRIYPPNPSQLSGDSALADALQTLLRFDNTAQDTFTPNGVEKQVRAAITDFGLFPKDVPFTVVLRPKFSTGTVDYSISFPGSFRPTHRNLTLDQLQVQVWDPFNGAAGWRDPQTAGIREGDVLFFLISGLDVPTGQGFWSKSGTTWSIDQANTAVSTVAGIPSNIIAPFALTAPTATITYSEHFFNVGTNVTGTLAGDPPLLVGQAAGATFNIDPPAPGPKNIRNGFWGFIRLDSRFYENGADVTIRIRDPRSGGANPVKLLTQALFASLAEIQPRPILLGTAGITITDPNNGNAALTSLVVGDVISVEVFLSHLDFTSLTNNDVEVTFGTGWSVAEGTNIPISGTTGAGIVQIVAQPAPNLTDRYRLRFIGYTLGAVAGTPVTLTVRNVTADTEFPDSGHSFTLQVGTLVAPDDPPPPPPTVSVVNVGTLQENAYNTTEFEVSNVEPGAIYQFRLPGNVIDVDGTLLNLTASVDKYFIQGAIETSSIVIPQGVAQSWTPILSPRDPDGTLTTTVPGLIVELLVYNPVSTKFSQPIPLTIALDPDPSLVEISVAGELALGDGISSEWTLDSQVKAVTFTVVSGDGQLAGGLPVITPNNGYLTQVRGLTKVGNDYTADFEVSSVTPPVSGQEERFTVTKVTPVGAVPIQVSFTTPVIRFVNDVIIGGPGSGGGVGATLGASMPAQDGRSTFEFTGSAGVQRLTSSTSQGGVVFSTTPQEGRYSEFVITGTFAPSDSVGSNLTLVFEDADGAALSTSTTIKSASKTKLTGYALFGSNIDGRVVRTKITDSVITKTAVAVSTYRVAKPTPPRVRSAVLTPAFEGTTGATLTITGSGLTPPAPPTGASALTYSYSLFDSGSTAAFSNVTLVSSTNTQLVFTVDIAASTADRSYGIEIDYLGGNTSKYSNLGFVLAQPAGDPQITDVLLYEETADPDGSNVQAVIPKQGKTAYLRVSGARLGSNNVDPGGLGAPASKPGVYLEIVGEEDDGTSSDIRETAPGPGLTADLANSRLEVLTLIRQSTSEIIARVPATIEYSNLRARVWLRRPATHPDGAGEWDLAAVDATGDGNARGLSAIGTTVRYGQHERGSKVNVNPANGVTQLDVARSLQSQVGAGTEGNTVTLSVRLQEAVTTATPPAVTAVASNDYNVVFEDIQVAKTGSPFVIQITCKVPTPGVNNTYPEAAFTTDVPVVCGLQFANGHVIAGATLGASDWGDTGSFVAYSS